MPAMASAYIAQWPATVSICVDVSRLFWWTPANDQTTWEREGKKSRERKEETVSRFEQILPTSRNFVSKCQQGQVNLTSCVIFVLDKKKRKWIHDSSVSSLDTSCSILTKIFDKNNSLSFFARKRTREKSMKMLSMIMMKMMK